MARRISRGNFDGTVYYHARRGEWLTQITLAYDPTTGKRKRRTRYSKTKREALQQLEELKELYAHNIHFDADKITVRDWFIKWFETYKIPKLRENTQASYQRILDICIEAIGYMKLEKVQPSDLQYIIYHKIGTDHYRTCQYFRTVIKQAFDRAVVEHLLIESPADHLELPPKPPKKKFVKPTKETWQTLLDADVGFYGWQMIILTVMVTGMRRSEILALTWDSFHIERDKNERIVCGSVTIDKAMGIGNVNPETGRRNVYVGRTKSESGIRTLPLPISYIKELMVYRKKQNIMRLASKTWEHPEMLFTTNDGRYYNPDVFSSLYSRVCRENGIKTTFHMLRHDFATSMNSSHEFNFKDIQNQLGHSNIQITLDTYTHMEEKDLQKVGNWVDERYAYIVESGK
ncbi:site-specific integrase [uncultured Anaerovibrio sp.]|uniref:site-specific integrase n=1 Tax=uncultured Anaerovibrio sp. TaxID=361586 RepID=UPI0025E1558E|nr:site-specific integrase [uncultured Anaerovibrio sp.]